MARYNSLFRHLLRLKRVSMELDAAWGCLEGWTSRRARGQRTQQPLWLLRYHAAYHINNLLAYMQARCALRISLPYYQGTSTQSLSIHSCCSRKL